MSVRVEMWKINKRRNSTKVPTSGALVTCDCMWKEPVDLLTPVIDVAIDHGTAAPDDDKIMQCNYAKIYKRYYWITHVENLCLNHWRIYMEVDPLASWKSQITSTKAFVMYSQNAGQGGLVDTRLPRQTNGTSKSWYAAFPGQYNSTGWRVLGVQGYGAINYFAFISQDTINDLLDNTDDWLKDLIRVVYDSGINDESWGTGAVTDPGEGEATFLKLITQGLRELKICVYDGLQSISRAVVAGMRTLISTGRIGDSIISAMYFPFDISAWLHQGSKQVYLGQYPSKISALVVPQEPKEFTVTIDVTSESWFDEVYLRRSGYCIWSLYVPFLGRIAIPNEIMGPNRRVTCRLSINLTSGIMRIKVSVGNQSNALGECIGEFSTQVGFPYAVGTHSSDISGAVNNILGGFSAGGQAQTGAALIAAGNLGGASAAAGGVAGTMQSIWGFTNDMIGNISAIGNASGSWFSNGADLQFVLICDYFSASCVPNTVGDTIGVPTFKPMTLGSAGGYVQCSGASVSVPGGYTQEIDLINSYLNTGAYLE